jgi:hypothetical protein
VYFVRRGQEFGIWRGYGHVENALERPGPRKRGELKRKRRWGEEVVGDEGRLN